MNAQFKVKHAGPFVSVQDSGRTGYLRYGVSKSGPMDRLAHELSQCAIGRGSNDASIEVSLGGLVLECLEGSVTTSVAGGAFDVRIDGNTLAPWSVFTITAGSVLHIRPGAWGSWCYLSFLGDISALEWLGSKSVHLNSGICGRQFVQGDVINIKNTQVSDDLVGISLDPKSQKPDPLIRVVLGPQDRFFTRETISSFLETEYQITPDYNRMGMRLSGANLPIDGDLDMLSEPVARGSLQVPGHGDPICLLADHQTTGGYPKIATVISRDQDKIAQMRVGDQFVFRAIDTELAVTIARQHMVDVEKLKQTISQNRTSMSHRLLNLNLISGVTGKSDDSVT